MTMTSIMTRSFAEHMGWNWPPEIASIVNGDPVTFSELKTARIERQKRHMDLIMDSEIPLRRAAHIWTFYVPGPFYGGWHLYIRTIKDRWWIRDRYSDDWALIERIMKQFPCGLLPIPENFYEWKKAFSKMYRRGHRKRKQGMVAVWVDTAGHRRPMPEEIYF